MKKIKENKGITLIALIITIIVLLILAVVAISAVQGDGIIAHAKNARDEYQAEQNTENTMLGNYLVQLDNANEETIIEEEDDDDDEGTGSVIPLNSSKDGVNLGKFTFNSNITKINNYLSYGEDDHGSKYFQDIELVKTINSSEYLLQLDIVQIDESNYCIRAVHFLIENNGDDETVLGTYIYCFSAINSVQYDSNTITFTTPSQGWHQITNNTATKMTTLPTFDAGYMCEEFEGASELATDILMEK